MAEEGKRRKARHWVVLIGVPVLLASILGGLHYRRLQQEWLDRDVVLAARRGDFEEVRSLIARGANPDGRHFPEADGRMNHPFDPPLVHAVEAGMVEEAGWLIDAGADVNHEAGGTPLLGTAIYNRDKAMFEYLLQKGLDPNGMPVWHMEFNALHTIIDLTWREHLSVDESLEFAMIALANRCDPNQHGMHGFTPLIYAVSSEQVRMVELLLGNGAVIEEQDDQGMDAMGTAVFRSNARIIDMLVSHGGRYTIQGAVVLGRVDEVRKMLDDDESLVGFPCIGGNSLLGLALKRGHAEVAMLLVERGAELSVLNGRGESLLHLAAFGGSARMVRSLIDRGGDVMARDKSGDTPLHETTFTDRHEAARILIAAGADIEAKAGSDITPLQWAASYDSPRVLRLLIGAGADPNKSGAYDGALPLGSACHYSGSNKVPGSVRVLLELGADVNLAGAGGRPAVHWAAGWFGGPPLVRFLLEQGADPMIRDAAGETALDIAEREGKEDVAAVLRGWGEEPVEGFTPSPGETPAERGR